MIPIISFEIALAGGVAFAALLVLLHFLKPENDPSWRMISEYQIGRYGWLMRLAFCCWSVGFLGLGAALWQHQLTTAGVFVAIVAVSLAGAGVFASDPITTPRGSETRTGILHVLFGVLTIVGIPITATIVDVTLSGNPIAARIQGYLPWATLMVWFGLTTMVSALAFFGAKKVPLGPQARIGWPNRFMVFTYVVWLILIAGTLR
jgi:uncharacterized protein DUF998